MKFPKNRANLYLVERMQNFGNVVVGGFSEYNDAQDYAEACEQEWKDKVGPDTEVFFHVTVTTFYG